MYLLSLAGGFLARHTAWSLANLFATTFYGESAYSGTLTAKTWPGLALFFVIYGALGMVWGWIAREGSDALLPVKSMLPLWGGLFGILCFYFFFSFAWNRINPLIPLYAQISNLRAGHLLWGVCLSRSAVYAKRIAGVNADPAGDPEVKSGEVIV